MPPLRDPATGRFVGGNLDSFLPITFEILGELQLDRLLGLTADKIKDLRPAFDDIHDAIVKASKEQFETGGKSGSGPKGWKDLSPMYAAQKASRYPSRGILVATGDMAKSVIDPKHPNHIFSKFKLQAKFGSKDKKIMFHQEGTRRMPQRRVIELTEAQKRHIVKILSEWVIKSGQGSRISL
jgi:hypothetical protein